MTPLGSINNERNSGVKSSGMSGAGARATMHYDFLVFMLGKFIQVLAQRTERDQSCPQVEFFVFMGFADIDKNEIFLCRESLVEFLNGNIHI